MKHALLLCVFLSLSTVAAQCETTYFPPLQPVVPANPIQTYDNNPVTTLIDPFVTPAQPNYNYQNQNAYQNIPVAALSRLENKLLSQNFPGYSTENRIERLEQKLFGAAQSGDLNTRYHALQMASRNYRQPVQYMPTQIAQGGWRGILGGLGNSMTGTMTGFTPPINPYYGNYNNVNGFNNGFNNFNTYQDPYGMYRGYRSNRGYYDRFRDFGTGAGVTILD